MNEMKIVLLSVYFNNHQRCLSDALYRLTSNNFLFIETLHNDHRTERLGNGMAQAPYTRHEFLDSERDLCRTAVDEADVAVAGATFDDILYNRIASGKLIFRYSERPLKNGLEPAKYFPRLLRWHWRNPPGKPIYMLCASAFTAGDYRKFGLFRDRCYKWGYFPETRLYPDLGKLFANKSTLTIVWCGRFLDWKHPDDALEVARHLKADGMRFALKLIGTGPLEDALRQRVQADELQDCVELLGAMSPEKVRDAMEQAGIFLFTSDRKEGWGAVLNEAMNSGCAAVASDAVGSVPYLVKDGKNGLVYHSGDVNELYEKVKWLLEHPEQQRLLGEAAYRTIADLWNAEVAAKRFMQLSQAILDGDPSPELFPEGPCSRAEVIREDWYRG